MSVTLIILSTIWRWVYQTRLYKFRLIWGMYTLSKKLKDWCWGEKRNNLQKSSPVLDRYSQTRLIQTVTSLCLENDIRIAMDATTACHLMSDPFFGHDYSYSTPIRVVQKLVHGTFPLFFRYTLCICSVVLSNFQELWQILLLLVNHVFLKLLTPWLFRDVSSNTWSRAISYRRKVRYRSLTPI